MPMFLGFMRNNVTHDEFVVPVEANSRSAAEVLMGETYPAPVYALLTVYERKEMEHVMAGLERWPGLPSKVQPSLNDLLSRVNVRQGKLPPLPHERVQPRVDGAVIQQVREAVSHADPKVQALAARLLAAQQAASGTITPRATVPTPTAAPAQPAQRGSALDAIKAMRAMQQPQQTAAAQPAARPAAQVVSATVMQGGKKASLIDVLKAMRG